MRVKRFASMALAVLITVLCLATASPALAWTPYDKVTYANADPDKYRIELDLTNCIVTVYGKDASGNYTDVVRQSICSPGKSDTPTPTGTYTLNNKRRRFGYFSEYNCYAQYWVNVVGGIYFHSILYNKPVEGAFTSTSYNALGSPASHGCIRMLVEDVRWIYYNCPSGTQITITKSKAKNTALHDSLMPKVSAKNYKPEADEYEAAKLSTPTGTVKTASVLTDKSGSFICRVEKGATVTIVESAQKKSKVQLTNGKTGYLENENINFHDNSPAAASTKVYVTNRKTKVYAKPTNTIAATTTLAKNTEVTVLSSTVYFYQIKTSDGTTGYVLKQYVDALTEEEAEALEAADTVYKIKKTAKVYEKATNTVDPIATLKAGTEVDVLSSTVYFYKVKASDGTTGYVLKKYVESMTAEEAEAEKTDSDEDEDTAYFTVLRVKSKQANLYAKPTNTEEPIGCFGKGTDVYLTGEATKYYYAVRIDDQTGYILKEDVAAYRVAIEPGEEYESQVYPITDEDDDTTVEEVEIPDEDETTVVEVA